MLTRVYSASTQGIDAIEVEIEVNGSDVGEPKIIVVGLPDAAVRESKDRVTTALANSGYRRCRGRTTINLAPADVKKEGPSFDLPMAIGMIAAAESADLSRLERCLISGELALNGEVRPIKGALAMSLEARRTGKKAVLVPKANAREAALVRGVQVYPIQTLREAWEFLTRKTEIEPVTVDIEATFAEHSSYEVDFQEVQGQAAVKRAIEVAVAGNHNVIIIGPPGSGKSMLAKRIPTILPPMTLEEAIETTKIHSVGGCLGQGKENFVARRPFRSPHHTISDAGLIGGSSNPSPGEISLAHNGVLFLDELPEFRRSTLEVLRQPLEDSRAVVSRAVGTVIFPADFLLVAALNPCPCGNYGNPKRECRCSPGQVERYRGRISGPLLDRIDIHIEAPAVDFRELAGREPAESSESIRGRIEQARAKQKERFGPRGPRCNARMNHSQIRRHCKLGPEAQSLLEHAMTELNFSARAYDRILKVARTIADLANSPEIEPGHVGEAIQYRTLDRTLWV